MISACSTLVRFFAAKIHWLHWPRWLIDTGQLSDSTTKLLHQFGKDSRTGQSLCQQKPRFFIPKWCKSSLSTHFNFFSILLPIVQLTKILRHPETKVTKMLPEQCSQIICIDQKNACLNRFKKSQKICGTKGGRPSCNPQGKVLISLLFVLGSSIRFSASKVSKTFALMIFGAVMTSGFTGPGCVKMSSWMSLHLEPSNTSSTSHGCGFLVLQLLVTPHEAWEMERVYWGKTNLIHQSSWKLPEVWPEMKVSRRQDQACARMQLTFIQKEEKGKNGKPGGLWKAATEVPFKACYLFAQALNVFNWVPREDHKNIKRLPTQKSLSGAQPPAPWSWQIQLRHVQDSTRNSNLQA